MSSVRRSNRVGWNRRGPTQQELFESGQKLAHYRMIKTERELLDLVGSERFNAWVVGVVDPLPDNVSDDYVRKLAEQEIRSYECTCGPRDEIACPACVVVLSAREIR